MRRLLFILLFALFVLKVSAQEGGSYAVVRVFDCTKTFAVGALYVDPQIMIAYENGETETVELQPFTEKTEIDNLKVLVDVLNKMRKKGYTLVSSSATGEQGNLTHEYVFMKP